MAPGWWSCSLEIWSSGGRPNQSWWKPISGNCSWSWRSIPYQTWCGTHFSHWFWCWPMCKYDRLVVFEREIRCQCQLRWTVAYSLLFIPTILPHNSSLHCLWCVVQKKSGNDIVSRLYVLKEGVESWNPPCLIMGWRFLGGKQIIPKSLQMFLASKDGEFPNFYCRERTWYRGGLPMVAAWNGILCA